MHLILNAHSLPLTDTHGFLLDLLRAQGFYSVKAVCREGDCGACQVLIGRKSTDGSVHYRTFNSCLLPVADLDGCHVITTEGLQGNDIPAGEADRAPLTPVQKALLDAEAIQCGYCTPGFVMALTGWLLNEAHPTADNALDWLSGNLCRCTGYMGMRRAIDQLLTECPPLADNESTLARALRWGILPAHIATLAEHLPIRMQYSRFDPQAAHYAGATDLAIEHAELWHDATAVQHYPAPAGIEERDGELWLGAGTDIETVRQSPLIRQHFAGLADALTWFASRPIRHQATVGGNIAHASPAADLAVMLMALQANVILQDTASTGRSVLLKDFYTGYKQTCLQPGEWIAHLVLPLPRPPTVTRFHFEKVGKRNHQDIASASVGLALTLRGEYVESAGFAVGGVAPVPLCLDDLAQSLAGDAALPDAFITLALRAKESVSPISDVRGSSDYKRALIERLTLACAEALTARETV